MYKKKYKEFEDQGVEATQRKLDQGLYAGTNKTAAEAFLKEHVRKEVRQNIRQNTRLALAAVIISFLALVVSVIAIFK